MENEINQIVSLPISLKLRIRLSKDEYEKLYHEYRAHEYLHRGIRTKSSVAGEGVEIQFTNPIQLNKCLLRLKNVQSCAGILECLECGACYQANNYNFTEWAQLEGYCQNCQQELYTNPYAFVEKVARDIFSVFKMKNLVLYEEVTWRNLRRDLVVQNNNTFEFTVYTHLFEELQKRGHKITPQSLEFVAALLCTQLMIRYAKVEIRYAGEGIVVRVQTQQKPVDKKYPETQNVHLALRHLKIQRAQEMLWKHWENKSVQAMLTNNFMMLYYILVSKNRLWFKQFQYDPNFPKQVDVWMSLPQDVVTDMICRNGERKWFEIDQWGRYSQIYPGRVCILKKIYQNWILLVQGYQEDVGGHFSDWLTEQERIVDADIAQNGLESLQSLEFREDRTRLELLLLLGEEYMDDLGVPPRIMYSDEYEMISSVGNNGWVDIDDEYAALQLPILDNDNMEDVELVESLPLCKWVDAYFRY